MYCVHVHCTICTFSTYVYSCFENTKIIKKNLYCVYVLHKCNFKPNSIVYIEESFASKPYSLKTPESFFEASKL